MKTQEAIMQELIDENAANWLHPDIKRMQVIEDTINACRSDPDLARYVRLRMTEIIKEAEKHGD